jgi:hypothetical protein
MNQAHVLIMHHHSEIRPLSIKPQSFHLSKVDVRALHLGVEPAERYHLAEHCQSADISTQPPARQGLSGSAVAWLSISKVEFWTRQTSEQGRNRVVVVQLD